MTDLHRAGPRLAPGVLLAIALALALIIGAAPGAALGATGRPAPVASGTNDQILPPDASTLVEGDDACDVLTDEEILRAVGGRAVVSRTAGPQSFLPAGCVWEIEVAASPGPATLYLGAAVLGGRSHYDMMVPFDGVGEPVAGVGEEAVDLGFGSLLAVEGESAVALQITAQGAQQRPGELVARALAWAALERLHAEAARVEVPVLTGPGVLPTDRASLDLVAAIRTDSFEASSVAATEALLASVGIGVVDPETGIALAEIPGPRSPLGFLDFQAHSMGLEAWAGNGHLGAELDDVLPMPHDMPLTSSILAGWLAAVDTPAARLGRALMAGQDVTDPTSLVFPTLALALFGADVAADADTGGDAIALHGRTAFVAGAPLATVSGSRTAQAAGICSSAQRFIDDTINTVFEFLKVRPAEQGPGRVVAQIWNWLVDRGRDFVRTLATELAAPVVAIIRTVAGTVSTIAHVVAALVPYTVVVYEAPERSLILPFSPDPPKEGLFVATVTSGQRPDWPPVLADCAATAGATLPRFQPAGDPIAWSELLGGDGLLLRGAVEEVLDEAGTSRFHWVTAVQPAENQGGEPHEALVRVEVKVTRADVAAERDRLKANLFGTVPNVVRPFVERALGPAVDGLLGRVTSLLDASGRGAIEVVYHTPPEPEPLPSAGVEPQPSRAVWVHKGRYEAVEEATGQPWSGEGFVDDLLLVELYACSGPSGPWQGYLRTGAIGTFGGTLVDVHEFPVEFSLEGAGGRATASVRGSAVVDIDFAPGVTRSVPIEYAADIAVDGTTMSYHGLGGDWVLDIEPAPAGACAVGG